MGTARAKLLELVRDADVQGRFRIYTPVTERGEPIYVHAKIMIVDARLLRLGSSNLNNRSMGYDTECDLIVEVNPSAPDAGEIAATIRNLRNDLLGEHLGRSADEVDEALGRLGSLIEAIEELRGPGRSLHPFVAPEINSLEVQLAESDLLDPESVA